jgi:hypothetical protein
MIMSPMIKIQAVMKVVIKLLWLKLEEKDLKWQKIESKNLKKPSNKKKENKWEKI